MFGWSPITIIVILVIVFLIFGAGKLPEIGSGFGKAIKNFKNSLSGKDEIDVTPEDSKNGESKPKKKQIAKSSSAPSSVKRKKQAAVKTAKTTKKR
ncbi:MAG: twin-arginine translocase TatA/TatE family subunit [bacterium]